VNLLDFMRNFRMKERIERISRESSYVNTREIVLGDIPYTVRDVLVAAPLIAALNVYLVGGTGEGKTQLVNDLAGMFGDSFCYAEGRPDFEPSELLKQVNLAKLKDAASDKDLVELTENVNKALYYVDELNRCPPIIMNYFFNFFDGKLVHNGKVLRLGNNGYSVGYASGNIGNGAYVGISDTDRALRDRMHLIVKLDDPQFMTTEEDDGVVFGSKKDPRATPPTIENPCLEDVLALNAEFRQRETPLILPALGIYFHKGLDYLQSTPRHSKRVLAASWPNVSGVREDTDESKIMPLSKRAILANIGLTQALQMIAEARGRDVDTTKLFLDGLRLTIPYSGVLAPQFVDIEHNQDPYAAFDAVMEKIRADIADKREALEAAVAIASLGGTDEKALNKINPLGTEGKWLPVRRYIEGVASNSHADPKILEGIKKEDKKR